MHRLIVSLALFASCAVSAQTPAPAPVSISERQEADGSTTLVHEVVVDAKADAVWEAVSTAEGWRTWAVPYAQMAADEPDVLVTSYAATATDASSIRQQFTGRVSGKRISFRTVKAPEGFPHFETYRLVTSTFELTPQGDKRTAIRLTATGFADSDPGRELLGFFREGNRISLERLRQRFVDGPMQWPIVN